MSELSEVFKALADPTRLRILNLLLRSPFCVCELEETLGLPQPLLSRHLSYLRNRALVESWREGMRVNYKLNREHKYLNQLHAFLARASADDAIGRSDVAKLSKLPFGPAKVRPSVARKRNRHKAEYGG